MAANRWVHQPGEDFDCTPIHGRYCTINMIGQDVGYARVGVVSSDSQFVLFRFRGRQGLAAKAFIADIVEIKMTERLLKKEGELSGEEWDGQTNPFRRFVGTKCDIHMHQTRMFEATPGFFAAKVLYVDERNQLIRVKENSKQFNISIPMICGIMETSTQQEE